jgi:hypothetical protein
MWEWINGGLDRLKVIKRNENILKVLCSTTTTRNILQKISYMSFATLRHRPEVHYQH